MTTANTPILKQILQELSALRSDVTELKVEVKEIRKDVNQLQTDVKELQTDVKELRLGLHGLRTEFYEFRDNMKYYMKEQSLIQERSDTYYITEYLNDNIPTLDVTSYDFGKFYNPNGQLVTDIDGCIIMNSSPKQPFRISIEYPNNSKYANPEFMRTDILFLESKNSLDKVKVDMKLTHFVKILSILKNRYRYTSQNTSRLFKEMLENPVLESHPKGIYFMICGNDLPYEIKEYIQHINNGSITEELYNTLSLTNFRSHSSYKKILDIVKKYPTVLKQIKKANTVDELLIQLRKRNDLEEEKLFIEKHFVSYSSMKPIFDSMKGNIGYKFFLNIQLPMNINLL